MSIFSPEALLKMLGIDAREFAETMLKYEREFESMKIGFGNAIRHFDYKLSEIERKQDQILFLINSQNVNKITTLNNGENHGVV